MAANGRRAGALVNVDGPPQVPHAVVDSSESGGGNAERTARGAIVAITPAVSSATGMGPRERSFAMSMGPP